MDVLGSREDRKSVASMDEVLDEANIRFNNNGAEERT